ncbi:MAG: transglutaminase [Rhodocyclaceae bacterium]|nr:transglutaminase [Rhodocyclaceae bacterium]
MIHTPPNQSPEPGPEYLASARFIDSGTESVRRFAQETVAGATTDIEKAVKLFYRIRDGWRYDPFTMSLDPEPYIASNVLKVKAAYCLPKAILLAAAARAAGIHRGDRPLRRGEPPHHGEAEGDDGRQDAVHAPRLCGAVSRRKWVKAAPAFNIEMCEKFHVHPTEFDGTGNAIFQEYDMKDRRHMEYVRDHGCWSDFPFEKVMADFRAFYPAEAYKAFDPGELFEDGVRIS